MCMKEGTLFTMQMDISYYSSRDDTVTYHARGNYSYLYKRGHYIYSVLTTWMTEGTLVS